MTEQEMREKVIKGLEIVWDAFNRMEHEMYADYVFDAIALLKAQEPVKPKYVEFEDTGLTWEKYEVETCGKCGALLGDALYCPMCGQAVKRDG